MHAIKVQTTVDEATAQGIPELRPSLGKHVELIALEAEVGPTPARGLSVEELLAFRVDAPPGSKPLSNEDIERAIAQGALDGGV